MFDRKTWLLAGLGGFIVFGYSIYLRAAEPEIEVEVMHCHDGDTCRIKISDAVWMNVRLAGIDTPELKGRGKAAQPMAEEAKGFTQSALKGKKIGMRQTDLDHYNRPVVEFYQDKKLFNVTLVEQGLAEAYRGKTKRMDKAIYIAAEETAKKAKKGIWSVKDYVSPSKHRKK